MGNKKGQYFSFDAIMSALILVVAVSILGTWWFGAQNFPSGQEDAMQKRALAISDALLTSGNPPDWGNPQDAKVFGLANAHGTSLSRAKISALAAYLAQNGYENYNITRERYSVPEFFVGIYALGGGNIYSLGRESSDALAQAIVTRVAVLDGQIVNVRVVVWAGRQAP